MGAAEPVRFVHQLAVLKPKTKQISVEVKSDALHDGTPDADISFRHVSRQIYVWILHIRAIVVVRDCEAAAAAAIEVLRGLVPPGFCTVAMGDGGVWDLDIYGQTIIKMPEADLEI